MRVFVRWGYLPLMLVGANALAVTLVLTGSPKWTMIASLVVAIAVSFGAERVLPYQKNWNSGHQDTLRDWVHFVVNENLHLIGLWLMPLLAGLLAIDGVWPDWAPFWVQLLLAIIVLDAGITLCHYASHCVPVLWQFHAPHHSQKRQYGFNGLMKHPVHQLMETTAGALPLLFMGMPGDIAMALIFTVNIQLLVQHSNVNYAVGPLRYLLAVNQIHRFHHRDRAGIGDVNFGLFLTLWDHLLGTFHFEHRNQFHSDELGIHHRPDYPVDYLDQLVQPFADFNDPSPALERQ